MPDKEEKGTRDVQAFVVGALVILGLIFATYTYFNSGGAETVEGESENGGTSAIERIKDMISSSTSRDEEENEESGTETEEEGNNDGTVAGSSGQNSGGGLGTGGSNLMWVANDYEEGDISTGSYTVVAGDTLWEIAEAVYGNGAEWTRILQANSANVGFLPNGSQALIVTGQVLSIPQA